MNIVRFAWIAPLALAIGCGDDGGGGNNTPDAHVITDVGPDARSCTGVTPDTLDFLGAGNGVLAWGATVPGDLGDGLKLEYQFEFYDGIESSLSGTFDLAAGNQNNYSTCAICVRAFGKDADGNIVKLYFQSGGSITLTEDPFTNQKVVGSLTDLQLEEVTIAEQTYVSTPVPGGTCASFGSYSVDHDRVPNAWTCDHAAWDEGTNCNCACGLPDPDCELDATVVGCTTAGDACFNDECVTPPDNISCAAAQAITTDGTPVTGTTIGANHKYDAGLDGDTCTGVAQRGRDVVYTMTLAQDQAITVALSNVDPAFDAGVALLGPSDDPAICDASPIATCVAGADAAFEGEGETFTYTAAAPGTYYLIVSSFYTTEAGAFTLTVTTN